MHTHLLVRDQLKFFTASQLIIVFLAMICFIYFDFCLVSVRNKFLFMCVCVCRHVFDEGSDEYKIIMLNKRYLSFRVVKVRDSWRFYLFVYLHHLVPISQQCCGNKQLLSCSSLLCICECVCVCVCETARTARFVIMLHIYHETQCGLSCETAGEQKQ